MADLRQDIIERLLQCRAEIQANMAAKGINASGRTSRAFRIKESRGSIALVLGHENYTAPLDTLEVGRPAGNVPKGFQGICKTGKYRGRPDVSKTFKYILIKWAEDKGLAGFGWGAATNLGRKIAYEGTDRHRHPVQVWKIPVNRAVGDIKNDIRASVQRAVVEAAQSKFNF